jgi:predicted RNA binding protein YcfA (HicA-like mRNA interferase family)
VKLPRDLSGHNLGRALSIFGYEITRQTGSHLRLTTRQSGEHHITIPNHEHLRVGSLAAILADVADHFHMSRDELVSSLFG